MSEWKKFVHIVKTAPKSDILILIVTFALTVIFDLVVAIAVGLVLTLALFMKGMSDATAVRNLQHISTENDDNIDSKVLPENVKAYEIAGPLFFGVADKISEITTEDNTRYLVLKMHSVPSVDSTALNALQALYKKCEKQNVKLIFLQVNEQPLRVMRKSGFYDMVGGNNFCTNIDEVSDK